MNITTTETAPVQETIDIVEQTGETGIRTLFDEISGITQTYAKEIFVVAGGLVLFWMLKGSKSKPTPKAKPKSK